MCQIPYFSINYVNKFVITSFARRKRYPKTTIGAPTADHPAGFASLDEAFQWSDFFMTRLANRFGKDWLCDRLRSWRWTFSSAFSGVGAPESAQNLDVEFICNISVTPNTWLLWTSVRPWQVWSPQPERSSHRADVTCQLILRFFTNLLVRWMNTAWKFLRRHTICHATGRTSQLSTTEKKLQYCSTHKKMCKVRKNRSKNRFSVQVVRLVVVFGWCGGDDNDDDDDDDGDHDDKEETMMIMMVVMLMMMVMVMMMMVMVMMMMVMMVMMMMMMVMMMMAVFIYDELK